MEGVTGLAGGGEAREVIVGGLPGRRTASWGSSSSHVARRRGWAFVRRLGRALYLGVDLADLVVVVRDELDALGGLARELAQLLDQPPDDLRRQVLARAGHERQAEREKTVVVVRTVYCTSLLCQVVYCTVINVSSLGRAENKKWKNGIFSKRSPLFQRFCP